MATEIYFSNPVSLMQNIFPCDAPLQRNGGLISVKIVL
jgi:hypothetical protein